MTWTPQPGHGNLCATRDVVANLTQYIVAYRQHELGACGGGADEIAVAVHLAVERSVCLSMQKWLQASTHTCVAHRDPYKLRQRMAAWANGLPTAPQYGFAVEVASIRWDVAVQSLRYMDDEVVPYLKLHHLLASAKAIFDLHVHAVSGQADAASRALWADDFLPVFIFCVCQALLRSPLATLECMWSLCKEDSLKGEAGFYLTMLDAALEYIRTY
ncbi:hypothetical protein DYB28_008431 [Aphanomyces astaci]|uniref:VPS9 domain-containing protein n=1 Tax=Aphanomyces astaci TaxID=112090 RepID=A0A9X8H724_APHAT|nr:hypothetical protein DYB28_008431 [Aphanomyces astaci]